MFPVRYIDKSIIIEKEGEYPTSLWYYAHLLTTLYRVHDLCSDIHKQSGFIVCPSTSHTSGVVYAIQTS